MRINRFKKFPKMTLNDILIFLKTVENGCDDKFELYYTDKETFWFFDKDDEYLKGEEGFEIFEYKIESSLKKAEIVNKLHDIGVVVFITDGDYPNYSLYGVYRLEKPFTTVSGVEGPVTEGHGSLRFKLVRDYYEIQ